MQRLLFVLALAAAGVVAYRVLPVAPAPVAMSPSAPPPSAMLEKLAGLDQRLPLPANTAPSANAAADNPLLAVKSWGYQLQKLRLVELAKSPYDLLVIDYSRSGDEEGALTNADIARLRVKPDGTRRIVLCYLSIGEAEEYRYYWNPAWESNAPDWLGKENGRWAGNFKVRFWEPVWQEVILGQNGYLERIAALGFDGVYLDRIDAYTAFEEVNPKAAANMVSFVRAVSARGKALKPGFLIVAQNAEELVEERGYLAAIDGIAKEDLLFGELSDTTLNRESQIREVTDMLLHARAGNKAVLAVDYIADPAIRAQAATIALRRRIIPHFTHRELDSLILHPLPAVMVKPRN